MVKERFKMMVEQELHNKMGKIQRERRDKYNEKVLACHKEIRDELGDKIDKLADEITAIVSKYDLDTQVITGFWRMETTVGQAYLGISGRKDAIGNKKEITEIREKEKEESYEVKKAIYDFEEMYKANRKISEEEVQKMLNEFTF